MPFDLEELVVLAQATGVVMAQHQIDDCQARQLIVNAAHANGEDEIVTARQILRPYVEARERRYAIRSVQDTQPR